MRRLRPSLVVFFVALLASLGVHLPVYEALGVLAEALLHAPAGKEPGFVELELPPLSEQPPEAVLAKTPDEPKPAEPPPRPEREPELEPKPVAPRAPDEPKPEPKPLPQLALVKPEPPPPPPPPPEPPVERQSIDQTSDDPTVAPPEHARFQAEENRRVEEETQAAIRSLQTDDAQPAPTAQPSANPNPVGDAQEAVVADARDVEGSEERKATEAEARVKPEQASAASGGERNAPALSQAPPPRPEDPTRREDPRQASGAESGGEESALVVEDAFGSFRIRKRPAGKGPGDAGGAQQPGVRAPDRRDRARSEPREAEPQLKLSWSQFEQVFGSEELAAQRQAYVEQRRSRAAGHNRQAEWRKFRAAIENFLPKVQPGTQTALNTAASPFASYLTAVHRRIHREFAHGFLQGLPLMGGPFADRTLNTTLEIVINGDGSVHEVGVAKTSGFLPFDYGAFNAVMRAAPYPPPPRTILSGDGRAYVHWGFFRNERQCGTFNARPYILPNPGGPPAPGPAPLRDQGEEREPGPGLYEDDEGELGALPRPHHGA